MEYICNTDGFESSGWTSSHPDRSRSVIVSHGDIVIVDNKGYIWKNGVCFCHKDSIVGKYHFSKNNAESPK